MLIVITVWTVYSKGYGNEIPVIEILSVKPREAEHTIFKFLV